MLRHTQQLPHRSRGYPRMSERDIPMNSDHDVDDDAALSSKQWAQIKQAGNLKPADKIGIIEELNTYKQTRTASKKVRDKVKQIRGAICKIVKLINELNSNDEFLKIGTNEALGPDYDILADWYEHSIKLFEEMDRTDAQFVSGRQSITYPPFGALGELIHGVLMIQARSQGTTPPVHHRNSTTHPQFEKFVYLCCQVAALELKADYPNVRNKKIEAALKKVTKSFDDDRNKNRESWPDHWDYTVGPDDNS